jgi:hypothetical protein
MTASELSPRISRSAYAASAIHHYCYWQRSLGLRWSMAPLLLAVFTKASRFAGAAAWPDGADLQPMLAFLSALAPRASPPVIAAFTPAAPAIQLAAFADAAALESASTGSGRTMTEPLTSLPAKARRAKEFPRGEPLLRPGQRADFGSIGPPAR